MTAERDASLVLAFAKVLYVNGQATEETVSAGERVAHALGFRTTIMPRWGELQLVTRDGRGPQTTPASPVGVDMERVASTMHAIDKIAFGRLAPDAAAKVIEEIAQSPPAPAWLFALAAASGAVALA